MAQIGAAVQRWEAGFRIRFNASAAVCATTEEENGCIQQVMQAVTTMLGEPFAQVGSHATQNTHLLEAIRLRRLLRSLNIRPVAKHKCGSIVRLACSCRGTLRRVSGVCSRNACNTTVSDAETAFNGNVYCLKPLRTTPPPLNQTDVKRWAERNMVATQGLIHGAQLKARLENRLPSGMEWSSTGQNKTFGSTSAGCKAEFYWRGATNKTAATVVIQGAMTESRPWNVPECAQNFSVWFGEAQAAVYNFTLY